MAKRSLSSHIRTAFRDLLIDLRADRRPQKVWDRPYVFMLGFNKTATTTLHHFFEGNGFPSIHWDHGRLARTMVRNCMQDQRILAGYDDRFLVFSDLILHTSRIRIEANMLFRILDRDYPGAYFLFNNRPVGDWIASRDRKKCQRYGMTFTELDQVIFAARTPEDVYSRWSDEKSRFEREVRDYFRDHPHYLEFEISDPTAPRRIAKLLGRSMEESCCGHYRTNVA